MNIVCIGGGSIGLLLTAKLAAAGQQVMLVTHSQLQADALNGGGLTLQELDGSAAHMPVTALSFEQASMDSMLLRPDWILLAVKQKHVTEPLLAAVGRWLNGGGSLLCFQNGIGHVDKLAAYVPIDRLYVAVTTEGAKKLAADRVAHTGAGTTMIGPAGNHAAQADEWQKMMETQMNAAGFRTHLSNQMKGIVWNKLIINSVINPLTALLRIRNGELPLTEPRRQLMRGLLAEAREAAAGEGVPTRDDLWEQIVQVCANTAANSSSMLQDVAEGRKTEIAWINGAMIGLARLRGIPMPLHETICRLIEAAEPVSGDASRLD
ncbi:MAG: 2-dehydropantoate 2-reductase [Paenibacillus sp.]|nr:2-dehydropantoate 2-reductase [Paenibacillus sp.]